ncbi:MAG: hypothetical protein KAV41_01225 [Candidatus Pacebacteria bacterium]|nr:hypothetical protein [Candidatus Paceibacterota bacterium]
MTDNFIALFPVFFQGLVSDVINILYLLLPLWLPFILLCVFWDRWLKYVRTKFTAEQKYTLLEIKLPNEIKKTPLAMELVLNALFQTGGETTFIDRYFYGKTRAVFSLEMVSLEGQVRFFIWTRSFWKNLIESQIYAQYPDVEIFEVLNYTGFVKYDPTSLGMWACEHCLKKDDFYPIKSYIDYRLESEGVKEEEKSDPLTPILEFLGSVEQGQQVWLQIIVRAHKSERTKKLNWKNKIKKAEISEKQSWREEGQEEIKKLIEKVRVDEADPSKGFRAMTKGESATIAAIERSISKLSFDCNIRAIYLAETDKFNAINIMGLLGAFKQFNSLELNQFRVAAATSFNYPWQDFRGLRMNRLKRKFFNSYKRREFSDEYRPFVLNTEELATIFHFPGGVVQTPTLSRLVSKTAEPPINLPI